MLSKFKDESKAEEKIAVKNQYIVFLINDQEFGVEIKQTREIINFTELTEMPSTPDFVKGVINLRGEIVPIVDLYTRLELTKKEKESDDRIIVVEIEGNLIGMQVSEVKGIIRLSEDNIGSAPGLTKQYKRDFIEGVGKLDDRLIILLKLNKVLTQKEVEEISELEV